jgi:hypothetical protein
LHTSTTSQLTLLLPLLLLLLLQRSLQVLYGVTELLAGEEFLHHVDRHVSTPQNKVTALLLLQSSLQVLYGATELLAGEESLHHISTSARLTTN